MQLKSIFISVLFISIFFFIFLNVNYDFNLGTVFSLIGLLSFGYYIYDKDHTITFIRGEVTGKSIISGLGASILLAVLFYGAFVVISPIVLNSLNLNTFYSTNSVIQTFASEQTKILKGNKYIDYLSFGSGVPTIETSFFFGILPEFGLDFFHKTISWTNPLTYLMLLAIPIIFMIFHLTSKGLNINATASLALVLIFGFFSVLLVFLERSVLGATLMHIIANSSSLGISLGFLAVSTLMPIMLGLAALGGILYFQSSNRRILNYG